MYLSKMLRLHLATQQAVPIVSTVTYSSVLHTLYKLMEIYITGNYAT